MRSLLSALGSSLALLLSGLIRQKLVAAQLGPTGIGQLGLWLTLSTLASTVLSFGVATSGVQRIASTLQNEARASAQQAVLIVSYGGALLALMLIWIFAAPLGLDPTLGEAGVVACTAALLIASAGQLALLNGLGLLSRVVRANIISALLATALTAAVVVIFPRALLPAALLAPPAMLFFLGLVYLRGQLEITLFRRLPTLHGQLRQLLSMGGVVAVGIALSTGAQYEVRIIIANQTGPAGLGQYQAAWSLTSVYLGVLLSAMSLEYFPRLSRLVAEGSYRDVDTAIQGQVLLGLAMATPVICLLILYTAPVMSLLFSPEFLPAVPMAQQQFVGDIFKMLAWPFSYALLARQAKLDVIMSEGVWAVSYVGFVLLAVRYGGLNLVGWAYFVAYVGYALVLLQRYSGTGGRVSRMVFLAVATTLSLAVFHVVVPHDEIWRWGLTFVDLLLLTAAMFWFWHQKLPDTREGTERKG